MTRTGTAVFAATVKGTEPLSFQWRRDGVDVLGANSPILRLDQIGDGQAGSYVLHVSNPAGAVQAVAQQLTVVAEGSTLPTAPAIVTQPVAVRVNAGNTATFAVGAGGSGPLAYQWKRDNVDIPGATAAFYSIAAAAAGDAATYAVVVSNSAGSATSASAVLTVDAAVQPQAPVITAQPGAVVVVPGMSALLGVGVQGSGPMSFQWLRNGVAVAGQTQATYAIAAASALDAGAYQVRVSNGVGEVTSATAQVILLGAPAIVAQPGNRSVTEGASATFSVTASGDHLGYQWTRNQVAIAGATGTSFTTPALALADSGAVYAVIAYNGAGVAISSGAVLTVSPVPAVAKAWGTAALIETDNVGNAENVQVAVNTSGEAVAVWQQPDSTSINIHAARYSPATGWHTPEPIDTEPETSQQPAVAIDAQGNAFVVWLRSEGSSNSVWARRFTAQGGWGSPVLLETGLGDAGNPQVAVDGSGNAIVVFWQQEGGRVNIVANRYVNGAGWGTATAIETDGTGDAGAPQIAMDAAGNAMVVWGWAARPALHLQRLGQPVHGGLGLGQRRPDRRAQHLEPQHEPARRARWRRQRHRGMASARRLVEQHLVEPLRRRQRLGCARADRDRQHQQRPRRPGRLRRQRQRDGGLDPVGRRSQQRARQPLHGGPGLGQRGADRDRQHRTGAGAADRLRRQRQRDRGLVASGCRRLHLQHPGQSLDRGHGLGHGGADRQRPGRGAGAAARRRRRRQRDRRLVPVGRHEDEHLGQRVPLDRHPRPAGMRAAAPPAARRRPLRRRRQPAAVIRSASRTRLRSLPAGPSSEMPSGAPRRVPSGSESCGKPARPAMQSIRVAWLR